LIGQRPVDPLSSACDEDWIIEKIRQRNQTVEIVRPALPTLTRAAQPSTFRPEILPDFLHMSREAVSLDLKLPFQPALRPHGGKRQEPVRSSRQRSPVFHCALLGCGKNPEEELKSILRIGFTTIDQGPFVRSPLHTYRGSVSKRKTEACGSSKLRPRDSAVRR